MKLSIVASILLMSGAAATTDPAAEQQRLDEVRRKSGVWMQMIRESDDFAKNKQWDEAEKRLLQILSEREKLGLDLSGEQSMLARLYAQAGQNDKAEALFQQIIKQRETAYGDDDFTLVHPLNQYAAFLESVGRTAEAGEAKKRAADIEADARKPPTRKISAITDDTSLSSTDKADRLLALGKGFLLRDNATKARYALDKALAENPKLVDAYIFRAQALMQLEELQKALADLSKAVALDPKNGTALADRARVYQSLNKPKLALRDFTASIAVRPTDIETIGYRAKQYDALGQTDKAIADYGEVLKIAPQTRWALVQRAAIYNRLKNYDAALADINRVIDLSPDNSDYLQMREETLAKVRAGSAQRN